MQPVQLAGGLKICPVTDPRCFPPKTTKRQFKDQDLEDARAAALLRPPGGAAGVRPRVARAHRARAARLARPEGVKHQTRGLISVLGPKLIFVSGLVIAVARLVCPDLLG